MTIDELAPLADAPIGPQSRRERKMLERRERRTRCLRYGAPALALAVACGAGIGIANAATQHSDDEIALPMPTASQDAPTAEEVIADAPVGIPGPAVPVAPAGAGLGAISADLAAAAGEQVSQHLVQWPLEQRESGITDWFGPRIAPTAGASTYHLGVDFTNASGTKIGSIAAGTVVDVVPTDQGGLGVHVVIEHRIDGHVVRSVYGHMLSGSAAVKIGDQVKPGQLVGLMGSTGTSTGTHLHFGISVDGTYVDPLKFLHKYADGNQQVDIFGSIPEWTPDLLPSADGDGWTPEGSETYVPAQSVPSTPAPSAPADASTSAPSVEPSTPPDPVVVPVPTIEDPAPAPTGESTQPPTPTETPLASTEPASPSETPTP